MKRILLIVALICSVGFSFAQDRRLRADGKFTQVDTYLEALKAFKVPAWSAPTVSGGIAAEGSLGFNTTTSKLMVFDGEGWVNVTDTTDMSDYYTSAQVDALLLAYAKIDSVNAWLAGKVDKTVKINGYELTEDITLDADDIGALTEAAADLLYKPIGWLPDWDDVQDKPSTFPPSAHTHAIADVVGLIDSLASKQNVITGGASTITSSNLTTNRALVSNGSGKVAVSSVTSGELAYLSGVTSGVQSQLDDKIPISQKGANNGVAPLNSGGKVPPEYIDVSGMNYAGTWNASTNTPTLADGVGTSGDFYRVTVAGTQDLGSGNITFAAGDDVIYNGSTWEKIPSTQLVVSVNGQTGTVEIGKSDVGLGNVDNTSDANKPISTATQSALDDKENVANKATSFSVLNNTLYPTTQAVANYVTSQTPAAQTLSQPAIGQIAISGGNTINLNTVNTSGNQAGISGEKSLSQTGYLTKTSAGSFLVRTVVGATGGWSVPIHEFRYGTSEAPQTMSTGYFGSFSTLSYGYIGATAYNQKAAIRFRPSGEVGIGFESTIPPDLGVALSVNGSLKVNGLSGTGNGIVGVNSSGQLTRTNVSDFGYVPYTGATSAVNLNTQELKIGGRFEKGVNVLEVNRLTSSAGTTTQFNKIINPASWALNALSMTSDERWIIKFPKNTGTPTVFSFKIDIFNSAGQLDQLVISHYGNNSSAFSIFSRSGKVNSVINSSDATHFYIIIDPIIKGIYTRLNISEVYTNVGYSAEALNNKNFFEVLRVDPTTIPDRTIHQTVTNAQFLRDSYYLDYDNFTNTPTIGNGTLTLATSTGLSGTATFTANQTGNATFTVGIDSGYKLPTTTEWGAKADTSSLGTLASLDSGTGPGNVRTNSENDSRYLQLTGGTVTGAISWSGVPSSGNHLVNKTYVDNAVSSAGGKGEWIDVPATNSYTLTWDSGMVSKYGSGGSFQVWLKDTTNEYVLQQVPIKVTFSGSNVVSYTFTLSNVDAKIMVK